MRSYFSFRRASLNTDTWGAEGMPGPQWRSRLCRTRQLTNTIFLWLVVLFHYRRFSRHCRNLWFALQVNLGAWAMGHEKVNLHINNRSWIELVVRPVQMANSICMESKKKNMTSSEIEAPSGRHMAWRESSVWIPFLLPPLPPPPLLLTSSSSLPESLESPGKNIYKYYRG